jgi:hypothetical protein
LIGRLSDIQGVVVVQRLRVEVKLSMVDHFRADSRFVGVSCTIETRQSECLNRAIEQQVVIDSCRVYSSSRSHEREGSLKLEHWCGVKTKEIGEAVEM